MPRRHWILIVVVAVAAVAILFASRSASGADAQRGAALYALHCGACHTESVHGRGKRVATDFAAIRQWVERWNANLRLRWSEEEVDDVAVHLNRTYYRYPCPPRICTVVSLGPAPAR